VELGSSRRVRKGAGPAVLAVTALVGVALVAFGNERLAVIGGAILVVAAAAPMWLRLRTNLLDAVGLYGLVSALFFGLLSLVWLGDPPKPPPAVGREDVSEALLLVAGALAVFAVAARLWGRARPVSPPAVPRTAMPQPAALVVTFVLSVCATAAGLALGVVGFDTDVSSVSDDVLAVSQIILQLTLVGQLAVLACALAGFVSGDRRLQRLALMLAPAQFVAGFLVGFKTQSLIALVYVALAYIATRKTIPWRTFALVGVVATLILVPANLVYRYYKEPLADAPALTPGSVASYTLDYPFYRFRLIDHVALIRDRTPSMYPFGDGDYYTSLPAIIVVPRAVWPEKPVLDLGGEFAQTYWEIAPQGGTSNPLTQVGDLYRNFGVTGVFVGFAIWGIVVGAFGALRSRWRSLRMDMVYLSSLVTWVTYVESDLPELVAGMSRTLPVTILVAWLLLPGRDQPPGYQLVLAWFRERARWLDRRRSAEGHTT
jgi:hypothetical protein